MSHKTCLINLSHGRCNTVTVLKYSPGVLVKDRFIWQAVHIINYKCKSPAVIYCCIYRCLKLHIPWIIQPGDSLIGETRYRNLVMQSTSSRLTAPLWSSKCHKHQTTVWVNLNTGSIIGDSCLPFTTSGKKYWSNLWYTFENRGTCKIF